MLLAPVQVQVGSLQKLLAGLFADALYCHCQEARSVETIMAEEALDEAEELCGS